MRVILQLCMSMHALTDTAVCLQVEMAAALSAAEQNALHQDTVVVAQAANVTKVRNSAAKLCGDAYSGLCLCWRASQLHAAGGKRVMHCAPEDTSWVPFPCWPHSSLSAAIILLSQAYA